MPYAGEAGGLFHAENWSRAWTQPNKASFRAIIPLHPGFSGLVATSHDLTVRRHRVINNHIYPEFPIINIVIDAYFRDSSHQIFRSSITQDDFDEMDNVEKQCIISAEVETSPAA
jgi:hypothetical protein